MTKEKGTHPGADNTEGDATESGASTDFIREAVTEDLNEGRYDHVHTRFPPEPNGYLHIGHAKAISITFGVAEEFDGLYNLRFDDTNPSKEEAAYVDSQQEDIRWLGFDWEDRLYYASDYFEQLYQWAVELIQKGKAYVCDLSPDEVREYRGTLTEPGKNSPYRDRPIEESLDLFRRMRAGEFPDAARTLRAKIDMASPNLNMRDPVMYRIMRATHHRTGDAWCIYPMYDWAHGQSDSIEGITHSLCDLAYEDHRPLYDWFIRELGIYAPRQIEFARLNLSYTVLSKRRLLRMVNEGYVDGWDDARMPTLSGLRRRGYTPEAIRDFCSRIGVAKRDNRVDISLLEHCLREDLNKRAPRVMAVLDPIKLIIDNYPEDQVEEVEAENNPEDPGAGNRMLPFSKELYIERGDFLEDAPRKWFRLAPGKEVRLKHGYYVTCTDVIKDEQGNVVELHCTYDPATRGGWSDDGRKVRGTLHWVSAAHAADAEVRLYEHLFTEVDPESVGEDKDFTEYVNPNSREVKTNAKVEPGLVERSPGYLCQFLRHGYFCMDPDSTSDKLVFNRAVSLRDTWARIQRTIK